MAFGDRHSDIVERFWRDGYALIPGAFGKAEVRAWREIALADRSLLDLLSRPALRAIVVDERIVGLARDILGGQPIYFGDSTAAVGTAQGSGFHKDNTDRYDGAAPDWSVERYPTLRFGIYTQPHGRLPGGLDLRRRSHMTPDLMGGDFQSPAVEPGDLLVWNGRTTHSANSPKLRGLNLRVEANRSLWMAIRKLHAEWLYARHPEERVAFFVTYALAHPLLDRHIAYLKTRQYAVAAMRRLQWDGDAIELARRAGLSLIKPDPRDATGENVDYRPVPHDLTAPAQVPL